MQAFTCAKCNESHDLDEIAFDCRYPIYVDQIEIKTRKKRCQLNDDWCIVDKEHHFIKCNLEIPVSGQEKPLRMNVWASLSPDNFKRAMELWDTKGREAEPAYFGYFSNSLPVFSDTVNLRALVHTRRVGLRPIIELEPTEHPLSKAQHKGLSQKEYENLLAELLHASEN